MRIQELAVRGAYRVSPTMHRDARGVFFESFRGEQLERVTGHAFVPAQVSYSVSHGNVLRGMHGVTLPPGQAKYVTCVQGGALDVVLDTRVGSPTFGVHDSTVLRPEEGTAVLLPDGTAHGFLALTDDTWLSYVVDTPYVPGSPFEVHPFDPDLALPWGPRADQIVADKDLQAPTLAEAARLGVLPRYQDCLAHRSRRAVPAGGRDLA